MKKWGREYLDRQPEYADFRGGQGSTSAGAAGGLGGFSKTPEGKATVAAFVDSCNKMVIALRNYRPQEVKGGLGPGDRLKVSWAEAGIRKSYGTGPWKQRLAPDLRWRGN